MVNKTLMKGGASDDESEGHYHGDHDSSIVDQHGDLLGLVYEVKAQ